MKEKTSVMDKFSIVFIVAWVLLFVSVLVYKFWFVESKVNDPKPEQTKTFNACFGEFCVDLYESGWQVKNLTSGEVTKMECER